MSKIIRKNGKIKPLLRWAGGKSRIIRILASYAPSNYSRYWEPFLGSAAMYFYLAPKHGFLSDINAALISCYEYIRDCPEEIYEKLIQHKSITSKDHYYEIRDAYNKSSYSLNQAVRFIYLNKTSFNGIFRVNMQGQYNVPYGYKEPPPLPTLQSLKDASSLLKTSSISVRSYEEILACGVKANDFVYLDPPYPPLNGTSNFTHYTAERFSWSDQEKVANLANGLQKRGCLVMVSNSDSKKIRDIYKGWNFFSLPVVRWISANGKRLKVNELVITNYPRSRLNLSGG